MPFIAVMLVLTFNLNSQILFSDNFEGIEIDSTKWDVFLPYSDSAVYLQNGLVKSKNYGFIVSKQSFPTPYSVLITIPILSNNALFVLKSNAQFPLRQSGLGPDPFGTTSYDTPNGIVIPFGTGDNLTGSNGGSTVVDAGFYDYGTKITSRTRTTDQNGNITYSETDLWPNLEIFPNSSLNGTGGFKIGFFGADPTLEASISSIEISYIPEPSALSLLAVGLGGLAMMRRRRS